MTELQCGVFACVLVQQPPRFVVPAIIVVINHRAGRNSQALRQPPSIRIRYPRHAVGTLHPNSCATDPQHRQTSQSIPTSCDCLDLAVPPSQAVHCVACAPSEAVGVVRATCGHERAMPTLGTGLGELRIGASLPCTKIAKKGGGGLGTLGLRFLGHHQYVLEIMVWGLPTHA